MSASLWITLLSVFLAPAARGSALTRDRFDRELELFDEAKQPIENLTLFNGNYLKPGLMSPSPLQYLQSKGSRGILLSVENLSNKMLGDPRAWVRCGYSDSEYGDLANIYSMTRDVFVFHNKKKWRSSCGAVSWQLLVREGQPYRTAAGQGVRLVVTWSMLDTVRGNKCGQGKMNEMRVFLDQSNVFDSSGGWTRTEEDYWDYQHTKAMIQETTVETEGHSRSTIHSTDDGQFQVKARLDSGCTASLDITLLGRHGSALLSDPRLEVDRLPYYGRRPGFTRDEIWEQMVRQAWLDYVDTINRERRLYGVGLEPLYLDELLPEAITVNESMLGYQLEFWMWNVTVHGLSEVNLTELVLDRSESLNDLRTHALLDIGDLTILGSYQYKGTPTGWSWLGAQEINSGGVQGFSINMTGARFGLELAMDTVDGCGREDNLVITDIQLPLNYDDITFTFDNIGYVISSAVNFIGGIVIDLQKSQIVEIVRGGVRDQLPSLLCRAGNVTDMDVRPVNISHEADPVWWDLVHPDSSDIGRMRRDTLAEKFVGKIFQDWVVQHFSDENDTLTQLLDPFLLLPVNEDFRIKGVIKGHIIVCEFYMYNLRQLRLSNMELVRNEDLTYSLLRLSLSLPTITMAGNYRLNHVKIMSVVPAPKSQGTINITLSDVAVTLTVALRAEPAQHHHENANITIEHFEVDFVSRDIQIEITGITAIPDKVANKFTNKLANKVVAKQKAMINKEIKNILFGMADCIMYKPAQGLESCLDDFWASLGYEIPFTFPPCADMYRDNP